MSLIHRRNNRYYVRLQKRNGSWTFRAVKTRDRYEAERIGRCVEELLARGQADVVYAVAEGQATMLSVYTAWLDRDVGSPIQVVGYANQIYVIRRADTHEIKIGIASNPAKRLLGLQQAHAEPLELLVTFPGTEADETALHRRFVAHHKRGEWFHEAPEIIAWVAEIGANATASPARVVENG